MSNDPITQKQMQVAFEQFMKSLNERRTIVAQRTKQFQALLDGADQALRVIESTAVPRRTNQEEAMSNTLREVQDKKSVFREVLRTVVSV